MLKDYSTLVFDCDGVVLNSNRIKTDAFRTAAQPWGEAAAEALVAHHVANGGISRHRKFAYFLDSILPEHVPSGIPGKDGPGFDELLAAYALEVREGLMTCSVTEGLQELRSETSRAKWFIVSGGDQDELRNVFGARGLDHLFDGGIFGSPDNKDSILARELLTGNIIKPGLFLGDSRYDHQAASRAGLDFIFVSGWTEFREWKEYTSSNDLLSKSHIADLLGKNANH